MKDGGGGGGGGGVLEDLERDDNCDQFWFIRLVNMFS